MRLARFNLEITTNNRGHTKQFHGLPTPGAAGAVAGLIALHQHLLVTKFGDHVPPAFVRGAALGIPVIMLICGIVMISNISYVHVTNRFVRGRRSFAYAARLIVPLALLVWFLEETLAVAFTGYALSGPARLLVARLRRRRSTESTHPSDSA
jgi:CDP-diacylglycerol--serine O-phosphatidyltransferase